MREPHPLIVELIHLRESRGLACLTAGREAGISHGTINKWELGYTQPLLTTLDEYARSFGYRVALVPIEQAVRLEDEKRRTGGHEQTTAELLGHLVEALDQLFWTSADEHQGAA